MGQAKARGSFEKRKQDAVARNAADDAAQRKRVEEERFALNEWRRENPMSAQREKDKRLHAQMLIAAAVGMSSTLIVRQKRLPPHTQPATRAF